MIRIALDAMGGDHAPGEIIKGGIWALKEQSDFRLILFGPEHVLKEHLSGMDYPADRVDIVDSPEVIAADDAPVMAVRRKKNASMVKALRMVKEGEAEAMVSAGNTGALMAGGLLVVGRMEGIDRPALTIVVPTFNGDNFVLLDAGANMDAKAEHLVQYALMGNVYAREILGKKNPRVALLNVGTEEGKGNEQAKQAFERLKKNLANFAGNVEARDVFFGAADVVVADGFVGNILLKAIEGLAAGIFGSIKDVFTSDLRGKIGGALLAPKLRMVKKKLDYAEYGGAPLLGVDGVCIKAHGSSDARAIRSAILNQAYPYAKHDVNQQIRGQLSVLQPGDES